LRIRIFSTELNKNKKAVCFPFPTEPIKWRRDGSLDLSSSLELLVIDEADLIFSFGFEADLRFILTKLPAIFQVYNSTSTNYVLKEIKC
jgi:hypothetical protein